tara:strand:+ start:398 stop:499 length:102 start_codon:yes stop_codon:yes gene_type:complete
MLHLYFQDHLLLVLVAEAAVDIIIQLLQLEKED